MKLQNRLRMNKLTALKAAMPPHCC